MKRIRLIPVLTIDGRRLVKTVQFSKPNYIGDPVNAIKIFNDKEVDEIAVLDITASKNNKRPDFDLIGEMASECFMPLAYGGGIRNMNDITTLFSLGIEKIILNSCLETGTNLIYEASQKYGSQSIVVSLDIKKTLLGGKKAFFRKGMEKFNGSPVDLARQCEQAGAGELIIHSIDKDGTFGGYDADLVKAISDSLSIPTIACGGLRGFADMISACKNGASAVAGGSYFVYMNQNPQSILINYPSQKELMANFYTQLN